MQQFSNLPAKKEFSPWMGRIVKQGANENASSTFVCTCVFRDDGELGGFGWGENGANCKKGAFVPFFTLSPFLGGEQVGLIVK